MFESDFSEYEFTRFFNQKEQLISHFHGSIDGHIPGETFDFSPDILDRVAHGHF